MGFLTGLLNGANSFADQLINPTTGLGKLGAYLGAASGNPLGQAAIAAMHDQRENQDGDLRTQLLRAQLLKAARPELHYFQTNDGSEAAVDDTGKAQVLYKDPTPKVDWIKAQNGDGTIQLVPTIGGVPMMGASAPSAPTKPVGKLTPLGGAGGNASGGFR